MLSSPIEETTNPGAGVIGPPEQDWRRRELMSSHSRPRRYCAVNVAKMQAKKGVSVGKDLCQLHSVGMRGTGGEYGREGNANADSIEDETRK